MVRMCVIRYIFGVLQRICCNICFAISYNCNEVSSHSTCLLRYNNVKLMKMWQTKCIENLAWYTIMNQMAQKPDAVLGFHPNLYFWSFVSQILHCYTWVKFTLFKCCWAIRCGKGFTSFKTYTLHQGDSLLSLQRVLKSIALTCLIKNEEF